MGYLPRASNKLSHFLIYIPLSLGSLLVAAILAGWGIQEVYSQYDAEKGLQLEYARDVWFFLQAIFKILAGIIGLLVFLVRNVMLTRVYRITVDISALTVASTFFVRWIQWASDLMGGWEPSPGEITRMVGFTLMYLLYFGAIWWIISMIASLEAVYKVGGTGWEGKNYMQVYEQHKQETAKLQTINGKEMDTSKV